MGNISFNQSQAFFSEITTNIGVKSAHPSWLNSFVLGRRVSG